ncbi:MAG: PDZ domain-containing protein [Oscillospiraceae bacterium]|nr:PDZ domain-containing protein [Oscillospiraceae bacterium]
MKRWILTVLGSLLLATVLPTTAYAQELIVGGQAVGICIRTEGVLVVELAPVETAAGSRSPGAEAGLQEGDRILAVDGAPIHGAAELIAAVGERDGEPVELRLMRGEQSLCCSVQPALSADGRWMLGLWLRDAIAGIGTVTFFDPETGVYGALGHSISEETGGPAVPVEEGSITEADIFSVVPGAAGTPGALNGDMSGGVVLGTVERNNACGVYGTLARSMGGVVAETGHFRTGPATILATVEGREVREYAVRIDRVYRDGSGEHATLTVTDPELRALTGGIVQGMSGSPILQEGELVGAVTHVFVNDPSRGYALSIQDMLQAAGLTEEQSA